METSSVSWSKILEISRNINNVNCHNIYTDNVLKKNEIHFFKFLESYCDKRRAFFDGVCLAF